MQGRWRPANSEHAETEQVVGRDGGRRKIHQPICYCQFLCRGSVSRPINSLRKRKRDCFGHFWAPSASGGPSPPSIIRTSPPSTGNHWDLDFSPQPNGPVRKHVTDMFGKSCVPADGKFCVKSVNIARNNPDSPISKCQRPDGAAVNEPRAEELSNLMVQNVE
ncbi:hypothetical protein GPALN_012015 [Globodera pallida]|nr:hypothetical protein GPALN_012015 [Globodera pallida]